MVVTPSPGAWPLSAPATAMLHDPQTSPVRLLRLALRELVVRGAVRVRLVEQTDARPAAVLLAPGDVDAATLPVPLPLVAQALLPHLDPDGTAAHTAVTKASGWRGDLPTRVRDACRDGLTAAGLLAPERSRLLGVVPRTRWQLTPTGRAWAGSATVVAAGALPAAGLLLALDLELQRRLRDAAGSSGDASTAATWADDDLEALDAVLGEAGPGLDSATDGGAGADGGGGDGGGGGD